MEGTILSLLPPVVAIVACIILREAISSLFLGVFVGALIIYDFNPLTALFRTGDTIMVGSATDTSNMINLMFTATIGGMVEVFNQSPSTRYILQVIGQKIKKRSQALMTIWGSGMVYFIDDYANSLIIGNGYRKMSDQFKISRAKLAFMVDTTAAPMASIALVSTWIGFEISLLNQAVAASNIEGHTGFGLFFISIPYRFYPVLIMLFAFLIAWSQRDYGPMVKAERDAIAGLAKQKVDDEIIEKDENVKTSFYLPLVPLVIIVCFTLIFLFYDGYVTASQEEGLLSWEQPWLSMIEMLSAARSFHCLLWATMLATLASFFIHTILLRERWSVVFKAWRDGCQMMFPILIILILAWSIGSICVSLQTDAYVVSLMGADFNPYFIPLMTFILASFISFATGTSYGTMSILIPVITPLVAPFGIEHPDVLYAAIGSVLGGAIFGDHCSPISDTTILSAGASGCSVIEHVRTQLPYALTVGFVSCFCLLAIVYFPIHPIFVIGVALVVLLGVLMVFGQRVDEETVIAEDAENDAVYDAN